MRRRSIAVLGLLVLVVSGTPSVASAEGSGTLLVQEGASLFGAVEAEPTRGALAFRGSAAAVELAIAGSRVVVEQVGSTTTVSKTPVGTRIAENAVDEERSFNASRLRIVPGDEARASLVVEAPRTAATLQDPTVAPVVTGVLARLTGASAQCADTPRCIGVSDVHEIQARTARADLGGEIRLFLAGATLVVEEEGGAPVEIKAGRVVTEGPATRETRETVLFVRVLEATGSLAHDAPATWYLTAPVLHAGAADLDGVQGTLRSGTQRFVANTEDIHLEGALEFRFAGIEPAASPVERDAIVHGAASRVVVTGALAAISIEAVPVPVGGSAPAGALVAAGLAAALAAAWAWPHLQFHATSLALPLYTRLQKPDILDNAVRNRIFDIIRGNPGISARGVHRQSEQSWGTVVYHLRQLERHHVVVSRAVGRTRNYYENHGKYKGMEIPLACLQSERARRLARIVAGRAGITQEQLVEASGLPQPTASYYVRKLKRAGLVEEGREGRYVKYVPSGDLTRFLEIADATAGPAGQPPDALNA